MFYSSSILLFISGDAASFFAAAARLCVCFHFEKFIFKISFPPTSPASTKKLFSSSAFCCAWLDGRRFDSVECVVQIVLIVFYSRLYIFRILPVHYYVRSFFFVGQQRRRQDWIVPDHAQSTHFYSLLLALRGVSERQSECFSYIQVNK